VFVPSWTRLPVPAGSNALTRPDRWFAGALAVSVVLLLALLGEARLSVDVFTPAALPIWLWLSLTFGTALVCHDGRGPVRRTLRDAGYDYGLLTVLVLMGAVASYPVAALSHGYVDATLDRMDTVLHFHWLAWYETVAAHPSLQLLGRAAYRSIYLSPVLLFGHFAVTDRRDRAHKLMATFWLAAVIALVLFPVMPAAGPFERDWQGHIPYMPDSALWQPEMIIALREHAVHRIDLGALRGLVSAPSFHTAAAVLYIRAAWPIAKLRWPLLLLNAAMLLATPVEGTHYLTDILLGALVAAVAITAVQALAGARASSGATFALRWRG